MPKSKSIKKVVIIGSGGVRVGQAAEFDYSGSQALKALKEEGVETVLINPNVATIQTSTEMATKVYLEPITPAFVEKIIRIEKPDGILLSFGGQTALNVGVKLAKRGVFKKYKVKVLGTPVEAIMETEDRENFRKAMQKAKVPIPPSKTVSSVEDALEIAEKIGYPVIVRPAYTLGGLGSSVSWNKAELRRMCRIGLKQSMIGQVLVEKYLHNWKEIEYEVVRDSKNNCITVCNMENIDAMGVHTGDSIVVAPCQTLTNKEIHMLRSASIRVIRSLNIIGECNIQFALDPKSDQYYAIEVNARLSRSSALASKATGYPLAYIAAKLAVGYTLDELVNKITRVTKACFEPALDYMVIKIPRWEFQKFKDAQRNLGSQMKAIGEVMALGRTFEETLQKAVRELEIGMELVGKEIEITGLKELENDLKNPTDRRLFRVVDSLRLGMPIEKIYELSGIDPWFLHKIKRIIETREMLEKTRLSDPDFRETLVLAKKMGFSDEQISECMGVSQSKVRDLRKHFGIVPCVKQIDTLAAEYPAKTNYLYFTYNGSEDDPDFKDSAKVLVIGAGPIRIGSSVEFDWCTMNCVWTLKKKGLRPVVINCNPETVSTDYDMSDKLYFEEITLERVLDIIDKERPLGVIVSVGGQTSNNLAYSLAKRGVALFGTFGRDIDSAENRHKFSSILDELGIAQPRWKSLTTFHSIRDFAKEIGYPVIIRPSYVLSGSAMKVAWNVKELEQYVKGAVKISKDYPVVVSKFIQGAKEVEVDGVCDGSNVLIGAVIEHIENAGVHSGDASMVIPPQTLSKDVMIRIRKYTEKIAKRLYIKGPFNMQYMVKSGRIYVIECNLRASRSMPYTSKTIGFNLIEQATLCMMGEPIPRIEMDERDVRICSLKLPMFSWSRLRGVEPSLGVEMCSTGEIACMGTSFEEAFLKGILAMESGIPFSGVIIVNSADKKLTKRLQNVGYKIMDSDYDIENSNRLPGMVIDLNGNNTIRKKAAELGIPVITQQEFAEALVRSLEKKPELIPRDLKKNWVLGGMERDLKISKVESGTVIDHINPGKALEILSVLKVREEYPNSIVTMATNVPSRRDGVKDILKIEGKIISGNEIKKVLKIAPRSTINLVKDFEVVKKVRPK